MVGKAQCEWEPGLMAELQELSEEEEGSGVGAEGEESRGPPKAVLGRRGGHWRRYWKGMVSVHSQGKPVLPVTSL